MWYFASMTFTLPRPTTPIRYAGAVRPVDTPLIVCVDMSRASTIVYSGLCGGHQYTKNVGGIGVFVASLLIDGSSQSRGAMPDLAISARSSRRRRPSGVFASESV